MSAIKKFFEKKAIEGKFKKAGAGKRLTDDVRQGGPLRQGSSSQSHKSASSKINEMTDEKKMAAMAALNRLEQTKENESKGYSRGMTTMKAELLAEQKEAEALARKYAVHKPLNLDVSKVVPGAFFTCPSLGLNQPLLKQHMQAAIEDYLFSHLGEEPELTSALMLHALNSSKQEVKGCVEVLQKYISNINNHPHDINYRKIKSTNKILNERVLSCKGANEFLQAMGFERRVLGGAEEGVEEEYLILEAKSETADEMVERLEGLREVLKVAEAPTLQLHRDTKIFDLRGSRGGRRGGGVEGVMEVPDDFYNIRPEELKREQKLREEAVKELGMLVTKEMRERERLKALRRYRYGVIRVRLPDEMMVQGTFRAGESLMEVRSFVSEMLKDSSLEFRLVSSLGAVLEKDNLSLAELDLLPASLLTLILDQNGGNNGGNGGNGGRMGGSGADGVLKPSYRNMAQKM